MEHDQTIITEEELDYWCKEYPDLNREEVKDILEIVDFHQVKENYWRDNPVLNESAVDKVVAANAASSYEYHLYNELNNEAP